jgi:hypothetical protein
MEREAPTGQAMVISLAVLGGATAIAIAASMPLAWEWAALPYGIMAVDSTLTAIGLDRRTKVQRAVVRALGAVNTGQLDEADKALADAQRLAEGGPRVAAPDVVRAEIALHRGEANTVFDACNAIIRDAKIFKRRRFSILFVFDDGVPAAIAYAIATQSLARVGQGDLDGAIADADAIDRAASVTLGVMARARLARAAAAARKCDLDEVSRVVEADPTLFAHATPRERALAAALTRLARRRLGGYRAPGTASDGGAPGPVASWVATFVPSAAELVDEPKRALTVSVATTSPTPPPGKKKAPFSELRALTLWCALFLILLLLTRGEPVVAGAASLLGFVFVGSTALWQVRNRAHKKWLLEAQREKDGARKREALAKIALGGTWVIAGPAACDLARLLIEDGRFDEARQTAARAYRTFTKRGAYGSDLLVPMLLTQAAVAEAALGKTTDAEDDLRALEKLFPTYLGLPAAKLRIELVLAARAGKHERIAELAKERTLATSLPQREELLADLALAIAPDADRTDDDRLRTALADPLARKWIDAVAPGLTARFAKGKMPA